jgi:hypothetical protein
MACWIFSSLVCLFLGAYVLICPKRFDFCMSLMDVKIIQYFKLKYNKI